MLTENNQTFCLFSHSLGHETTVIVETIDIAFITCVEENWTSFWIPVSIIDKIPNIKLCAVTSTSKMIYVSLKEVLLGVGSRSLNCKSS